MGRAGKLRIGKILIWTLVAIGLVTNLGTAALRINRIFPLPKIVDFASYYSYALALRMGESIYPLSEDFISRVQLDKALYLPVPVLHSPPLWIALIIPLTYLRFPTAAWIWMSILAACMLGSTYIILEIAHPEFRSAPLSKRIRLWLAGALIVITFGPCFLSLTLGQNSILIMIACLGIGRWLGSNGRNILKPALLCAIAVSAKIYPLIWVGFFAAIRMWKLVVASIAVIAVCFTIVAAYRPDVTTSYWSTFIVQRASQLKQDVFIDDQSIRSFLARMFQSRTYGFGTLDPEVRATVTWSPPLTLSDRWVSVVSYSLFAALAGLSLFCILVAKRDDYEGGFYLFVLISLLGFPHMERYNHVLLLPAMAWLWKKHRKNRNIVIISYTLVGVSRLTHFWAIHLGYPIGALATGSSLFALLLLVGSIAKNLVQEKIQPESLA